MKLEDYNHTVTERFVLFYGGPFSQWATSPFKIGDLNFSCAEHYMMYQKANIFCDNDMSNAIYGTTNPSKQKMYGRKVKGFNIPLWSRVCTGIVYIGSYAKYNQNPELKKALLDTGDRILVEASPTDRIWGIGLAETDPRALKPLQWNGQNLLGEVLMKVRKELRGE